MASGPWEKYAKKKTAEAQPEQGPWTKYAQTATATAPEPTPTPSATPTTAPVSASTTAPDIPLGVQVGRFGMRAGQELFDQTIGQLRDVSQEIDTYNEANRRVNEILKKHGLSTRVHISSPLASEAKDLAKTNPLLIGPKVGAGMIGQLGTAIPGWIDDPAKAVGDLASLYLVGKLFGGEGEKVGKLPKAEKAPKIPPMSEANMEDWARRMVEQDAKFKEGQTAFREKLTDLRDTANRKWERAKTAAEKNYAAQLRDYFDRMTKVFDDAKRETAESEAEHQRKVTKIDTENAAKMEEYNRKLAESGRRQTLTGYQERFGKIVSDMTKRVDQAIDRSFRSRWDSLRTKNANQFLDSNNLRTGLENLKLELGGHPEDLKLFREIIKRVELPEVPEEVELPSGEKKTVMARELVDAPGGEEKMLKPTSFQDGRRSYTALGEAAMRSSGNLRRVLLQARDLVGDELGKATDRTGTRREYETLKSDWKTYMQDWYDKDSPLRRLLNAKDIPVVVKEVLGDRSARMMQTIEKYRRFGGSSEPMKGLIEADKQASKLPAKPPEPVKLKAKPEAPEFFQPGKTPPDFPTPPGAPELDPEEPFKEQRVPKPPEFKKAPPPKIKPPKNIGALRKHLGSLLGAMGGAKFGHPWIGAGIGRNLMEWLSGDQGEI